MNRQELIAALESAKTNTEDAQLFQQLVSASIQMLGLSEREVAGLFTFSVTGVQRWMNGTAAPHPALRAPAYSTFIRLLQEAESKNT